MAISGDITIVGERLDRDYGHASGSAYFFDTSDPKNPARLAKLLPDDGAAYDEFGRSVAISGTTAVVGAIWDDDNVMPHREAKHILREKQSAMDGGKAKRDKPAPITLATFAELDRENQRGEVRPTTLEEHRTATDHACNVLGDNIALTSIGHRHVTQIKSYLRDRGCAQPTIRKHLSSLRAMMNRAVRAGYAHENPFAGSNRGKTQRKSIRAFSPDEVAAMVETSPSLWWKAWLKVLVTTGIRTGEATHLHWTDIDFTARTLTVSRKDAGTFAVGDEILPVLPWETKDHEERVLLLDDETASLLKRLQLQSGGNAYVFLSFDRLRVIRQRMDAGTWSDTSKVLNNVNRQFQVIRRWARQLLAEDRNVTLDKVVWPIGTPHDLRRTFGTEMARVVSIHVLCKWLGHSSMETTKSFYLTVDGRDADAAREALRDLYGTNDANFRTRSGRAQRIAPVCDEDEGPETALAV